MFVVHSITALIHLLFHIREIIRSVLLLLEIVRTIESSFFLSNRVIFQSVA